MSKEQANEDSQRVPEGTNTRGNVLWLVSAASIFTDRWWGDQLTFAMMVPGIVIIDVRTGLAACR